MGFICVSLEKLNHYYIGIKHFNNEIITLISLNNWYYLQVSDAMYQIIIDLKPKPSSAFEPF